MSDGFICTCGHLLRNLRDHALDPEGKCRIARRACGEGEPYCPLPPAPGYNPLGQCEGHRAKYLAACGTTPRAGEYRVVPLRKCALGCRGDCTLSGTRAPRQDPHNWNPKACWLMVPSAVTSKWKGEKADQGAIAAGVSAKVAALIAQGATKPPPDLANFQPTNVRPK